MYQLMILDLVTDSLSMLFRLKWLNSICNLC